MSEPPFVQPETAPAAGPSTLGRVAASGVRWAGLQTVGIKVITLSGQVVLGYLLLEKDFGVFALAVTVTMLTAVVERMGLREVLVQRGRRIDLWTRAALPFALSVGLFETVLVLALAPLAAWFYDSPAVAGVMAALALQGLPRSVAIVAEAKLRSRMRFRTLALTEGVVSLLSTGLMVGLALAGFGALSLALPRVAAALLRATLLWRAAGLRVRPRLHVRRWRYLAGASSLLLVGNLLGVLTQQADYMLLGLYNDEAMVGVYFFAFALSTQALQLVLANLTGVLFPVLTAMKDAPERQAAAYLKALGVLAAVAIPLGALQAAVADPLFRTIFPERWYPSIPLFQLLSLASGFAAVASAAGSLLYSQGRYATKVKLNVVHLLLFLALVWPAARVGPAPVAAAVLLFWLLASGLNNLIALRGHQVGALLASVGVPALLAAFSFGVPVWAASVYGPMLPRVITGLLVAAAGSGLYVAAFRVTSPARFAELRHRLDAIRPRR